MSQPLESWLERVPTFPGLLGAYVASPQQQPDVRSWSDACTAEGIQALHGQMSDVVDVLDAGEMPARKLRWIFGKAVVYFERRKDGARMCLITTHDPWVGENDTITNLITDFRSAV